MPLRETYGARRYNERVMLTQTAAMRDDFGQPAFAEPVEVREVYACVRQLSAAKTMSLGMQVDMVGLDIELRNPGVEFNGLRYRGHDVHFATREDIDGRGRTIRISGYYQEDRPEI